MIPQRIEPVFTERYESGESVLSAQVNSVKGVYLNSIADLGYNPIEAILIALDGNAADRIKQYDRAAQRGE